jgi:hypothetical protein
MLDNPPGATGPEFDAWMELADTLCLFRAPFGTDGTVHDHWSIPAVHLELPLIGSIYQHGLQVEGDDLDRLEAELGRLEEYWAEFVDPTIEVRYMLGRYVFQVPLLVQLSIRADSVRAAIRVARTSDGYLTIS